MKEKTTRQVLVDARQLLASGFNKGSLYCNGCFCALGAIGHASGVSLHALERMPSEEWEELHPEAVRLVAAEMPERGDSSASDAEVVWETNDLRGKAVVMAAFDSAIAKLPE